MSFIINHRWRYPANNSSEPFGPIIDEFAVVELDEDKLTTILFPMLRKPGPCYTSIIQWVSMMRWFEKCAAYKGDVHSWFELGEDRQIGVVTIRSDGPDPRREACPLIFTSTWLGMSEQEKCDAFNSAKNIRR